MKIDSNLWFELWYSDGEDIIPYHLLIVIPSVKNDGEFMVLDPFKNNEVVFRGQNYEEVSDWLTEDEYQLIEGRTSPMKYRKA